jgi:hypothetical protein
MFTRFTLALALSGIAAHGFSQEKPVVFVRHGEPKRSPDLARLASLQGSISIHLKISASGDVLDAVASTADTSLRHSPTLQKETVNLVRKWTFGCANCPPTSEYEHTLIFVYRLEGQGNSIQQQQVHTYLPGTSGIENTRAPGLCLDRRYATGYSHLVPLEWKRIHPGHASQAQGSCPEPQSCSHHRRQHLSS